MSPTDKAPESKNAPASAAPAAPTESTVSPVAIAEGSQRETKTKLADLDADFRKTQSTDEAITAAAAAAGIPPDAVPPIQDDNVNVSGGWGALSSLSGFFTHISDALGDIGKKFSEWLKTLMGTKDQEGADPDKDKDEDVDANKGTDLASPAAPAAKSADKAPHVPERIAEESEMLTPNAPVFSFAKTFDGNPYASDVPRIRPIHPVTHKHNVPHKGVDIPAPIGMPIFATHAMTMLEPKVGHVKCKLDDGTVVEFLHVGKVAGFKAGERIPKGAWIADTGNEGVSSGPHLHFQVNSGDSDPIPYLDPGLVASAEEKIDEKKKVGEWIPLESNATEHGLA